MSLHRRRAWDRPWLLSAAAAKSVAKGHVDVTQALLELDEDWIGRIIDDERV